MRIRLPNTSISLLVAILLVTSVAGCATDSAFSEDEPLTLAPRAHVFVPPLPECPRDRDGIPVRYAGKALLGKSVAFQGVLTLGEGPSCHCGCRTDQWRVVDATARVLERTATALLVWLPVLLPGDYLDSPDLDVIVTGVLREAAKQSPGPYYTDFLLEDAEVCRVKTGSQKHAHPFQHPPGTICVDLHG